MIIIIIVIIIIVISAIITRSTYRSPKITYLPFAQDYIIYPIIPPVLTHVSSVVLTAVQGWTVH